MHRGDLYCVWGNCLLPCLVAGDEKQLAPTIMTSSREKDASGNLRNRHVADGKNSPLQFFKATG